MYSFRRSRYSPAPTITATPAPAAITNEALGIEVKDNSGTNASAASPAAAPVQVKAAGPIQTVVTAVTSVFRSIRNFFGF